jgi:outer membrane protein OmpA-like peptidoglycan-associated protein/tetratricopeptide (TPR) repeat protein
MKWSFLLGLLLFSQALFAQNYSIVDGKAIKLFEEGQALAKRKMFPEALEKFHAAIKREANFLEPYVQIGRIYLGNAKNKEAFEMANLGLKRLSKSNQKFGLELHWLRYQIFMQEGNFQLAIHEFQSIQKMADDADKNNPLYQRTLAQVAFMEADLGKNVVLEKELLPHPLNQFKMQYFPVLTANGNKIFFTKRGEGPRQDQEDIYVSYFFPNSKQWSAPESISEFINTTYNEGTCTISADGNVLIYTSCNNPDSFGSCDLYISYKEAGMWQRPSNMGKNINTRAWESQPSLSADGRMLFFSSNRKGGFGGNDIWYSLRNLDGSWTEAKNLGPTINTDQDEISPFIYFNNEVLFFASNGHIGYGGMDIFLAKIEDGNFQEPRNMGFPINDPTDQFSLFITADRDFAYYSQRENTLGSSEASFLYRFKFPNDLDLGNQLVVTEGKVLNAKTGEPVEAKLSLVSLVSDHTLYEFKSDAKSGEFVMLYPGQKEMGLYVEKEGYLPKIYNVEKEQLAHQKEMKIGLIPIAAGESFVFENVFFDFDKFDLKPESVTSLKRLNEFMRVNSDVRIRITGHTDNVGNEVYNQELSFKRANSVRDFLISLGVSSERIIAEGKGSSDPIFANETPENRAQNRRIGVSVL